MFGTSHFNYKINPRDKCFRMLRHSDDYLRTDLLRRRVIDN